MRVFPCLVFLCGGLLLGTARAYEHFASPDRAFEAYTTANHADGTGMKLFVRRAGSDAAGILLAANDRWLTAKWSPDARFLAVIDHSDGHITDVYVFGVSGSDSSPAPGVALYAHNPHPGTYDVMWELAGWDLRRRDVLLIRDDHKRPHADRVRLHIVRHPLPTATWPILDGA